MAPSLGRGALLMALVAVVAATLAFACGGSGSAGPDGSATTSPADFPQTGDDGSTTAGSEAPSPDSTDDATVDDGDAPPGPGESSDRPDSANEPEARPVVYFIHTDW